MELLQVKIEKEEKVEKKFRKSFKKLRKVEEEKLKMLGTTSTKKNWFKWALPV